MAKSIDDVYTLYQEQMAVRGQPITEILRYPNNNYIPHKRYSVGKKFDLVAFNRDFDEYTIKQTAHAKKLEKRKLAEINAYYYANKPKKLDMTLIKNMSISQILIRWLDVLRDILSDILKFNYSPLGFIKIFTQKDRLYYVGLTLVVIGLICYIINEFGLTNNITNNNINISGKPSAKSMNTSPVKDIDTLNSPPSQIETINKSSVSKIKIKGIDSKQDIPDIN